MLPNYRGGALIGIIGTTWCESGRLLFQKPLGGAVRASGKLQKSLVLLAAG